MHEWDTYVSKKKVVTEIQKQVWTARAADFIKINIDAAFREDRKTGGWALLEGIARLKFV